MSCGRAAEFCGAMEEKSGFECVVETGMEYVTSSTRNEMKKKKKKVGDYITKQRL